MMIKKILSHYYYKYIHDTAFGFRIRHWRGNEPFIELKPFKKNSVVSDIFVWRCNEEWQTEFELFNITSFLLPQNTVVETCHIVFFDEHGAEINKTTITLQPFEKMTLCIQDYLLGVRGIGGFSVFHHSEYAHEFSNHNSHITERGYIAYKRKSDAIKSFCHGNLQSLAHDKNASKYEYVTATKSKAKYAPQLTISDSKKIELIYTNPTSKQQTIDLCFFDENRNRIMNLTNNIDSKGVKSLLITNDHARIHTFENYGAIMLWRPVIFKYYDTHFDVMHG